MAAVPKASVDGADLVVTESMQAQEAAFMERLAASAEGAATTPDGNAGAGASNALPGAAALADPSASTSQRERVLELMLAQAAKFSEFVNQSLARAGAATGTSGDAAGATADGAAASSSPAKRKGGKRGRASARGASKRPTKTAKQSTTESAPSVAGNAAGASAATASLKQPTLLTGGTLRQYQLEGYTWLSKLYENGINGILADEMGLGKTIQVIALVAHLREMKVDGPVIVVAPLSTVPNWIKEFNRFAPSLSAVLYHGTPPERAALRSKFGSNDVIVTSYEISMRDRAPLSRLEWLYLIVDEGHRLKNMECRLIRELKAFPCQNRLLLTGTPLQNNLRELFSLLNFLLPFIFDDVSFFVSMFDLGRLDDKQTSSSVINKELRHRIVSKLHEIVRPFLLRRVKTDVALGVPPKCEVVVFAGMSPAQVQLTEAIHAKKLRPRLRAMKWTEHGEEGCDDFKGSYQNKLMQLRKCSSHPYLFAEPVRDRGAATTDESLVRHSGKMQVLDRLLAGLKRRGHRVLLFSQMTKMLDIFEDFMALRGYGYCRIDGETDWRDRQGQIDDFAKDSDMFCFLLSTRAGGLGINLTAADTVIIYDSDWNPHQDSQAQDRCHRIGQTKPVVVYRLVTQHSVDVQLLNVANGKRKLERLVITRGKFKSRKAAGALTEAELKTLLSDHVKLNARGGGIQAAELKAILDREALFAAINADDESSSCSTPRGSPASGVSHVPLTGSGYEVVQHRSSAKLL